jgi:hypothetical protein
MGCWRHCIKVSKRSSLQQNFGGEDKLNSRFPSGMTTKKDDYSKTKAGIAPGLFEVDGFGLGVD